MKLRILTLALIFVPFFAFSQLAIDNNKTLKKESQQSAVKSNIKHSDTQISTGSKPLIKPCSEEDRIKFGIPEDFPRMINTGNPRKDEDDYYKAQQIWIKNNPKQFEQINYSSN